MTSRNERFRRLHALFDGAIDLGPAARPAWCAAQCAGDAVLLDELLTLLAADARLANRRARDSAGACARDPAERPPPAARDAAP